MMEQNKSIRAITAEAAIAGVHKVTINDCLYEIDQSRLTDISLSPALPPESSVTAFGLAAMSMSSVISVEGGAKCNCFSFRDWTPHVHGTHAETRQHLLKSPKAVITQLNRICFIARLVTVSPQSAQGLNLSLVPSPDDRVITREQIIECLANDRYTPEVIIIRTPNFPTKRSLAYSGTNPAYPHHEVAKLLVERGVKHVVLDCPSADREVGELYFHRTFWQDPINARDGAMLPELKHVPPRPREDSAIVELAFIPDEAPDGWYLIYLCPIGLPGDAAPVRPMIAPLLGFP